MRYHENCVSLGTHCLSCLSFPNDFSGHCRSSNDLSVTNNSQTVLSRTSFCRTKQQPNCPCSCTWRHIQPISDCHLQRQACRTKAHKAQSSLCCSVFCALIVLSVVFPLFFTWWLMLDINILKLSTSSLYKKCLSSARFLHDIASWYEGTTGEPCVGNALNDFQLYNSQKSLFKKPSSK